MTLYIQIIGLLMSFPNTRPNIFLVVNILSQYLVKPRCVYLIATKHVMRYLKCTIDFGLYYDRDHDYRLYGYTDSDSEESSINKRAPHVDVIVWDLP